MYLASLNLNSEFITSPRSIKIGSSLGFCGTKRVQTCDGGGAVAKLSRPLKVFWRGKSKNNFSGPEKFFSKFASWKGLPLQLRFGQLEKHLKSSLPALKGVWKGKSKNNFSGPEKLFFNLPVGRVSHCNYALGSWKST